jgi:TrkA domain protein
VVKISETNLPGVGVRLEFTTDSDERVGVLLHRGGRRELMVYDKADPDTCRTVMHLNVEEAVVLGELLGASRISEVVTGVEQEIEGLSIDWLTVPETSPFSGKSLGDGMFRTNTGVSIVAVIRGGETHPAPDPGFVFAGGDVAVAVGTPPGIDKVRVMLNG